MRPVIIVFAKLPVPYKVKTRLIPRIGPEATCRISRAFVEDTLTALEPLIEQYDVEVHSDQLSAIWKPCRTMGLQVAGDLGARMLAALCGALEQGRTVAAIIGSDSPTLPVDYLVAIVKSRADVCLGPTSDGGFYAISCRRTAATMFDGVQWSTTQTLQQTLQSIRGSGLTTEVGKEWYDVDCSEDLDRLIADPRLRSATRKVLLDERLIVS